MPSLGDKGNALCIKKGSRHQGLVSIFYQEQLTNYKQRFPVGSIVCVKSSPHPLQHDPGPVDVPGEKRFVVG